MCKPQIEPTEAKAVHTPNDSKGYKEEIQKHESAEYEEVNIFEDEQESQDPSKKPELFLGLIPKRYAKSFVGLAHGVSSIVAMVLANYVFLAKATGGWWGERNEWNQGDGNTTRSTAVVYTLFASNFVSATTVVLFFWNKVQAWRTGDYHKKKGLGSKKVRDANRARGPLALLLQSIYPLVLASFPTPVLNDQMFSFAVALSMIGLAAYIYVLVRDYAAFLTLLFASANIWLAVAIIQHGSIGGLSAAYPALIDFVELEAAYVISLCQHGFLGYYLYSRRLVCEEAMTSQARYYHRVFGYLLMTVYAKRLYYGFDGVIPAAMQVHGYVYALALAFINVAGIARKEGKTKPSKSS